MIFRLFQCFFSWFVTGNLLIVCKEAIDHFFEIVNTIGGTNEKLRADEFTKSITVVESVDVFKVFLLLFCFFDDKFFLTSCLVDK